MTESWKKETAMLIDLEWTRKYVDRQDNASWLTNWETDGNSLVVTWEFPDEIIAGGMEKTHRWLIGERVGNGIYFTGANFHNDVRTYTDWEEEINTPDRQSYRTWSEYDDKLKANGFDHDDRWEELRQKANMDSVKFNPTYGHADNLKQILKKGRYFTKCDLPYVLSLRVLTPQNNPGWRWHKNGMYYGTKWKDCRGEHLGDTPQIDFIIQFNFVLLKKKSDENSGKFRFP